MTENQKLIGRLLDEPAFVEALGEALSSRVNHCAGQMRSFVRAGKIVEAAGADGQLFAYESIIPALKSFSRPSNQAGN